MVLSQATLTRNTSNTLYRDKEFSSRNYDGFHQALNTSTDNAISIYAGLSLLK